MPLAGSSVDEWLLLPALHLPLLLPVLPLHLPSARWTTNRKLWSLKLNCLLYFSPFSHFTHLQPDGLPTEMESQAQLSPRQNVAPKRKPSKLIPKRRDVWAPANVSTEQHLHGVNYNKGALVADGLPEKAN